MNRGRGPNGDKAESGFTLIEILISIVILTMIAGGLSAAFVTGMKASANNSQSSHTSNDAQLIASYLVRDAQAAGGSNPSSGLVDPTLGVSVNWISENGGSDPDPSACQDLNPSDQLKLRLAWADRVDATTSHLHLAKYYYVPPAGQTPGQLIRLTCIDGALDTQQTLGHKISSTPATPTVTCSPAASCPGLPKLVSMTISEIANPIADPNNPSSYYTYTLTASLRPSSDVPAQLTSGNSAQIPLLALGGGNCSGQSGAAGFEQAGNSTLRVYGGVLVTTPGTAGCPAFDFQGAAHSYTAAGLPQVVSLNDPYASLPTPAGTCSGGSNPGPVGGVYQPNVYPQALPSNAALAPGVFVLCADVPSGLHGTGVMLYLAQGTLNWSGGTTNLTAASSGPYAGVAIWQPSSNASTMSLQGNASLTIGTATPAVSPPMGSGIYAPAAEIDLAGTPNISIGWLIAKTILVTGNHTITVGVPPATLPTITGPATLPAGLVGSFYGPVQINATGGAGGDTWTVSGPSWLSINSSGQISGTPTAAGSSTVTVTITDNLGDVSQTAYPLTIDALPTVTSLSPSSLGQGATNQTVAINGTGFINGATVAFSGSGITINSTTWVSATKINVNISVASNAPTGSRTVTVTNPDTGAASGSFAVNTGPSGLSTSPNSMGRGITGNVTVNGTGFVAGASLAANFGSGITVNSTTFNSSTKLTVNVTIAGNAALGSRTVTVTNGDGGVATGPNAFSVTAPAITSVVLANGGSAAGTIEKGDTITIVFSSQMSVASFCSTWSNDASNQSLSVNNDVKVTLTDGGTGNDTITVTSGTCAFGFGNLNLGSGAYVSGSSAIFTGSGGNKSSITWTASTQTMLIKLGAKTGTGVVASVASSAPIYTPGAVTDSGGAGLTNSPFPLASAKQF